MPGSVMGQPGALKRPFAQSTPHVHHSERPLRLEDAEASQWFTKLPSLIDRQRCDDSHTILPISVQGALNFVP